ncbi:hypothetical protein ABZ837_25460 [Streptomyces sp. NPDC047197]
MRQMERKRSDGEGVSTPAAGRYVHATGVGDVRLDVLDTRGRGRLSP